MSELLLDISGLSAISLREGGNPILRDVSLTLKRGERFGAGRWHQGTSGAPVLEGALVSFDCRLDKAVDNATHVILIGHVIATVTEEDPGDALIYADGHFTQPAAPLPMAASA